MSASNPDLFDDLDPEDDYWLEHEIEQQKLLIRDLGEALAKALTGCRARYCTCDAHVLVRRSEDASRRE